MKNPDRVAFTIFDWPVYWYGILMAAGILVAVLIAASEAKRKKFQEDTILDLCLILIPCGVVGARLYYVLLKWEYYAGNLVSIFKIWEGGLAIYGAVIGGVIGALIYARVKKVRFLQLTDLIAPGLVLAQSIGRWGNFFNQEAFGLPVTNKALLWFPLTVRIDDLHEFVDVGKGISYLAPEYCPHEFHLATFFYESAWCLLIFLFLWFVLRKRVKHDGDLFLGYLALYGFERMFVEGLRGDSLLLLQTPEIRISQLLSFLLFFAVVLFVVIRRAKEKKTGTLIWPAPAPALAVDCIDIPAQEMDEQARETILNDAQALNDILDVDEQSEFEEDEAAMGNEKNEATNGEEAGASEE